MEHFWIRVEGKAIMCSFLLRSQIEQLQMENTSLPPRCFLWAAVSSFLFLSTEHPHVYGLVLLYCHTWRYSFFCLWKFLPSSQKIWQSKVWSKQNLNGIGKHFTGFMDSDKCSCLLFHVIFLCLLWQITIHLVELNRIFFLHSSGDCLKYRCLPDCTAWRLSETILLRLCWLLVVVSDYWCSKPWSCLTTTSAFVVTLLTSCASFFLPLLWGYPSYARQILLYYGLLSCIHKHPNS